MKIHMLAAMMSVTASAFATAAEPSAQLSVTRKPDGSVVATAAGSVRACGITAIGDEPSFMRNGNMIDIHQPTAGIACMNPPPQSKPYRHDVDLGKLPPGTYTIRWNFPKLETTYTVK
jgi:hypothetical protein